MKKKRDIRTSEDIQTLVDTFYKKILQDDLLKAFFSKTKWENHLPLMYTFWENIAFYSGEYSGNPISLHRHIHQLHPLTPDHFHRWVQLFSGTVDAYFEGPVADTIKQRASSIADVLRSNLT
jgi:hemoglobin